MGRRLCLRLGMGLTVFLWAAPMTAPAAPATVPVLTGQGRPMPYKSPSQPVSPAKPAVTTIRYSGSAQAANMIMPAIWMGLPPLVILALIIRAFSKD